MITILTNIVQIAVLLVWKNFALYTAVVILFVVIKNGIEAVAAKKMYPAFFIREKDSISRGELYRLLKDCGALFVYRVNGVVLNATDNLVLSTFIGLSMVGMYSNYFLLCTTIQNFMSRIYQSCRASLGNLFATEGVEKQYFMFELMNFVTVLLYGTSAIVMAIVSNEFISLWIGEDYVISTVFSFLLGLEILTIGMRMHLGQIRNITGAFRQAWHRPIAGALLNLMISVVLVRYIGIYGVLIGTILADVMTVFAVDPKIIFKHSFSSYKTVKYYYKDNFVYFVILAVIAAVDYEICSHILVGRGIVSLIFHCAVCALSVPCTFLFLYRKTEYVKYMCEKAGAVRRRKR